MLGACEKLMGVWGCRRSQLGGVMCVFLLCNNFQNRAYVLIRYKWLVFYELRLQEKNKCSDALWKTVQSSSFCECVFSFSCPIMSNVGKDPFNKIKKIIFNLIVGCRASASFCATQLHTTSLCIFCIWLIIPVSLSSSVLRFCCSSCHPWLFMYTHGKAFRFLNRRVPQILMTADGNFSFPLSHLVLPKKLQCTLRQLFLKTLLLPNMQYLIHSSDTHLLLYSAVKRRQ